MPQAGFPPTPLAAFARAQDMARLCNKSIIDLCIAAGVSPSPVYRWKTNTRSYDVSIFGKLVGAYEEARKKKAPKKK